MFEGSAFIIHSISLPNAGGIAVSSYALTADFRIPGNQGFRKKARRLNLLNYLIDLQRKVKQRNGNPSNSEGFLDDEV